MLLFEVLIADLSSVRNRVLISYIPALPFLINAWISGNVTSAILANSTWHWGNYEICIHCGIQFNTHHLLLLFQSRCRHVVHHHTLYMHSHLCWSYYGQKKGHERWKA